MRQDVRTGSHLNQPTLTPLHRVVDQSCWIRWKLYWSV